MELSEVYKAILDSVDSAVVACDLEHNIVYMNPFAIKRYHRDLTGQNLLKCHNADSVDKINKTIEWFKKDKNNNKIYESFNEKENKDVYMVALRNENGDLIGYWEKHNYRNRETDSFYNFK